MCCNPKSSHSCHMKHSPTHSHDTARILSSSLLINDPSKPSTAGPHLLSNPLRKKILVRKKNRTYKNLDQIIRTRRRNKILIFIKIYAQDIIGVSVYLLDIFPASEVPNSAKLIGWARGKNTLVCGVPNSLVNCLAVLKGSGWTCLCPGLRVPKLYESIHGGRKECSFVYMVPFTSLNFCLMTFE